MTNNKVLEELSKIIDTYIDHCYAEGYEKYGDKLLNKKNKYVAQLEEALIELNTIKKGQNVLKILKPRIKLKESSLKNIHYNFDEQGNIIMEQDLKETPVVFIQSSGFVFKNSAEHKALKRWLNNEN